MGVHDEDTCGVTFSDLANYLTTMIHQQTIRQATQRLQRCKEARLDATNLHGEMNDAHASVYNLIEYLQDCIVEINKTVRFAEIYGGKTTITYEDRPMRFIIELSVKGGKRIYTIKAKGYEYRDISNE